MSDSPYLEIPLTQGQVARVSPERFQALNEFKWYAWWSEDTKTFYAARHTRVGEGRGKGIVYMHREIMEIMPGDPRKVDHRNHDTLDNRDGNLRAATRSNQQHNQRKRVTNTSGYKGVSLHRQTGKWAAEICVNWKRIRLGLHATPEAAHAAYCAAAEEHHGEFRCTG